MLVSVWTEEEEKLLIENYPKFGAKYCSEKLSRSIGGIRKRAKILKLKWGKVKKSYHKEFLESVVRESQSIRMVLDRLNLRDAGGNYKVVNKYIKEYNLDTSHFIKNGFKKGLGPKNKIDINYVLVENSNYNRNSLKKRLYKEGILERKCCLCGQDENWNGMKISLILDHINGINNDNRLENLRIVCPNCNAGLDTFAGKNIKHKSTKTICQCGNNKNRNSNFCGECFHNNRRKVERPSLEQLKKEVEELGYSATGRKYNVSDNSIRKWINTSK